ncbi:MAG TPA: hypothetical protein VKX17_18885 [Planctomycetota bacterium]|nr:hypothetical protein [Planctomycetota bacterium]
MQSYSAGLELEVSSADPATIQQQLAQLYASLNCAIDAQLGATAVPQPCNGNGQPPPAPPQQVRQTGPQCTGAPVNRVAQVGANANGNGRTVGSTLAQQKALWAISKSIGADLAEVLRQHGVSDVKALSVKQASELIDELKAQQNSAQ